MDIDELTLMAERVGELEQKLKDAQNLAYERSVEKDKAVTKLTRRIYWDLWWHSVAAVLVLVAILVLGGYPLFMCITTDKTPTHCTILPAQESNSFQLVGVVPWNFDIVYGKYANIREARGVAAELECEVKNQR